MEDTEYAGWGERILAAIKAAGLNPHRVQVLGGWAATTQSAWTEERSEPGALRFTKLCEICGADPYWVITGKGSRALSVPSTISPRAEDPPGLCRLVLLENPSATELAWLRQMPATDASTYRNALRAYQDAARDAAAAAEVDSKGSLTPPDVPASESKYPAGDFAPESEARPKDGKPIKPPVELFPRASRDKKRRR